MTKTRLAIVGTAGRGSDKDKLSHLVWDRMVRSTTTFILSKGIDPLNLELVSGGAAWADHLVVTLARLGAVSFSDVTLYLPTTLTKDGFVGESEWAKKTANTCNYYHRLFSSVTGVRSIDDLNLLQDNGANVVTNPSGNFKARNTDVAKFVGDDGHLLAYTFGSDDSTQPPWTVRSFAKGTKADIAGLKDGGTADTFNKCNAHLHHARLAQI